MSLVTALPFDARRTGELVVDRHGARSEASRLDSERPAQVFAQRRGRFGLSRALEALEVLEALAVERVRASRTWQPAALGLLACRIEATRQFCRWALCDAAAAPAPSYRSRLLQTLAEALAGDTCLRSGALAPFLGLDDDDLQHTVHEPRVRAFADSATDDELLDEVAMHGRDLVAPARGSFEAVETLLRALLLADERQDDEPDWEGAQPGLGQLVIQVLAVQKLEASRGPWNRRGTLVHAMGDLLRSQLAAEVLAVVIARQDLRLPEAALERCREQAGDPAILEAEAARLGQRLIQV